MSGIDAETCTLWAARLAASTKGATATSGSVASGLLQGLV